MNKRVLITGASSGIGLGLLEAYHKRGYQVTAVNRRVLPELEAKFPGAEFHHFDVRQREAVKKYFQEASASGKLPDVYFLNAGINRVDNLEKFDPAVYREVMEVNLGGVMNFVEEALPLLEGRKAVFIASSSSSNIFPNPNCVSYHLSKLAAHAMFKGLDRLYRSKGIRFKSLILGPIATNIFTSGKLVSKLQAMVRDFITVRVEDSVGPIMRFAESSCQAFYFPKISCALFLTLRCASAVWPGFYKGSAPEKLQES